MERRRQLLVVQRVMLQELPPENVVRVPSGSMVFWTQRQACEITRLLPDAVGPEVRGLDGPGTTHCAR